MGVMQVVGVHWYAERNKIKYNKTSALYLLVRMVKGKWNIIWLICLPLLCTFMTYLSCSWIYNVIIYHFNILHWDNSNLQHKKSRYIENEKKNYLQSKNYKPSKLYLILLLFDLELTFFFFFFLNYVGTYVWVMLIFLLSKQKNYVTKKGSKVWLELQGHISTARFSLSVTKNSYTTILLQEGEFFYFLSFLELKVYCVKFTLLKLTVRGEFFFLSTFFTSVEVLLELKKKN